MTIIGLNLKKISAERKGLVRGEIKVNTKMNISNVNKEDMQITSGKDVLSFEFDFIISYTAEKQDVADIIFEGNVLYVAEPKEAKKIIEQWKKKDIPKDIRVRVLNSILAKCNVKALILEDEMGLPAHIPLPKFGDDKQKEKPKKKQK